jgi:hypothetical protein
MEKCVSILSDVVNEVVKEGHGDMMSNSDLPGQIVDTKR